MLGENRGYRKGLTLGLTLAEIFILLFFLLLLLLLGYQTIADKKQASLDESRKALVAEQEKVRKINELPKEVQDLVRKNLEIQDKLETSRQENGISQKLVAEKERKVKDLETQAEDLKAKNKQLHSEIRSFKYAQKGIDPPCWYWVTGSGITRKERPHHLMDVAVHDRHLLIRLHGPPSGRAVEVDGTEASTSYAEEYGMLPLAPLRLRSDPQVISLGEFAELTRPILDMGKNEQVREYSCVFLRESLGRNLSNRQKALESGRISNKGGLLCYPRSQRLLVINACNSINAKCRHCQKNCVMP